MNEPRVSTGLKPELTFGVDLGDRYSHFCVLDASGQVVEDGRVATSPADLSRRFGAYPPARVALEVGDVPYLSVPDPELV